ncbi:amidohydrolase, partial [Flavobacteriales bacterium]|nr:amidohydrolase [Flavobacteriales bacterium]
MRLRLIVLLLAFNCISILAQETFPVNGVVKSFNPVHAFINAHIILNPTDKINNGILLIQNERIIAVDTNLNIPEGAIIHDLNGDFIYPSFIDLYTDYGLPKAKKIKSNYLPQYESKKNGAYHWNEAIHPEIKASNKFVTNKKTATTYLKNGFGAVLTHLQDGIFRGTGALVLLSEKSEQENIILPKAASFLSFKKGVSKQKNPSSLMGSIALIRQTLLDAEWYLTQKNNTNLSYTAINNQQELPHIFTINDELDYSRVYKISDEFEIDFIIKGNGKEYSRIKEVTATDFPVIIPLNFPNSYDISNPETASWISLSKLKNWETAPYNPAILAKNGIEFCITSSEIDKDSDFITNLQLAVKKGLSKQDALAALTTTPANLLKIGHEIGEL